MLEAQLRILGPACRTWTALFRKRLLEVHGVASERQKAGAESLHQGRIPEGDTDAAGNDYDSDGVNADQGTGSRADQKDANRGNDRGGYFGNGSGGGSGRGSGRGASGEMEAGASEGTVGDSSGGRASEGEGGSASEGNGGRTSEGSRGGASEGSRGDAREGTGGGSSEGSGESASEGSGGDAGKGNGEARRNGSSADKGKGSSPGDEASVGKNDGEESKLMVEVHLSHICEFYNKYRGKGAQGQSLTDMVLDAATLDDGVLSDNSFLKPDFTLEFLWGDEKRLRVKLSGEYQISESQPEGRAFGWYQNDLRVSFECTNAWKVKNRVLSSTQDMEGSISTQSGTSTRGSVSKKWNAHVKGGVPYLQGGLEWGRGNDRTGESYGSEQIVAPTSYEGLKNNTQFSLILRCQRNKVSYFAKYVHKLDRSELWDNYEKLLSTELFSDLTFVVEGEWLLLGCSRETCKFQATKKLTRYKRWGDNTREVWQGVTRKSILNHKFDEFFAVSYNG